ncbi:serine hydrolase domain-containing protein [Roseicella frigidaeris]|uniref:1,4-butanediol diacrylate esterase n=1 Tax=Roseicella frigidaeris TaxID=2230885 RepID=A0A327M924_9PROT|nr:serine hydrolase domain-containing protein [Roseicella frigidaeris]RAI58784.1 1,4-butanediol diacrylate esterase [Roseicella frigidaeris]
MTATAAIDQVLREAVERGAVPGVVALAADRDGPIYEGAFGRRSLDAAAPMTPDTVFWIASMTKAVTSVAAMQLVEEGRLALDAPLGPLLPGLAAPQVLEGFAADGTPRLRPAQRPITLRHLLTHTAGFAYNTWNADIGRYMQATGLPAPRSGKLASLAAPLVREPGERWEYSIATDWVGRAVEAASGERLERYVFARILEPLGMADSGFVPGPAQRARRAGMHQRGADGRLAPIDFALPEAPEFFGGGGGLLSTGPDYLRFLRMLLGGGRLDGARVLRPETVAEMGRNQIGGLAFQPLRSVLPAISGDCDPFPGTPCRWGLGFLINEADIPGRRTAGSLAWAGLGNTWFWIDPRRGIAGLLLTQILPFADPAVLDLFAGFETAVYQVAA